MSAAQPAPADGQHDLTGTTVGRFAVRALLGAGGMGEVYRAEDPKLKRSVALKRVSQRLGSDQRSRQRILKEAERASGLNSPHIASVYDVLEQDGEVFLVMEYVEGTTLRQRLRTGRLPLSEFFEVAVQCAEALDAAHRKGIVHRDIKPENIMLTAERQVKVLDFGLARRLPWADDTAITGSLESDTTFGGTPGYVAPEALLHEELDSRSDIFSLGVVFYEVATGRHPFRANKVVAPRVPSVQSSPEPVSEIVRDAPADLDRVISKMLARDPEQRYATAADLLVDLRALQRGGSLPAPTVIGRPARRWIRSALRVIAVVVMLAVLLTAFPAVRQQWKQWFGGPDLPQKKHIAVLPFVPTTDDPDARAFAQGLTETLTAKLTQLTDKYPLQIVPPSEIRGQKIATVQEARVGLGVNLVLEGSMRQAGGLVRVTYNLVDAQTRRQLRGDTITAGADDPFAVEDRVVDGVTRMLEVELKPDERQGLATRGTRLGDAYELYLQGRGFLQNFDRPEDVDKAVQAFQRALILDPNYALAHAGMGEAFWIKYELKNDPKLAQQSRESCARATSLDPNLPAAHICLGTLYNGTGENQRAVEEFTRALEQEPTNDTAYRGLAAAYKALGRLPDAERIYRRAIALRPQYWAGYNMLGVFYYTQARYAEAAEMFFHVVSLVPDSPRGYMNLAASYIQQGRYADAIPKLERSVAILPTADAYSNLGASYFYLRRVTDAARAYEEAVKLEERAYVIWGNLGEAYSRIPGKEAQSVAAYQRAITLAQENLTVNPHHPSALASLARFYAMLGDKKTALAYLKSAFRQGPRDPKLRFTAALVYTKLGESGQALRSLQEAAAAGDSMAVVRDDPIFDSLRADPRFKALVGAK